MAFGALATALIALVALLHLAFLVLEMFLWDHPIGRRIFALSPEFSARSKALAANQGLYNGFLAAGLVWGLMTGRADVCTFFLVCVIIAGVYGAISVKGTILVTQGVPAALALGALLLAR